MSYTNPQALVSTQWLSDNLDNKMITVLDGTSHLPTTGRDATAEFAEKHIPGAMHFNIEDIADPDTALPHMLPSSELFANKVGALGIKNENHIVVYDVYGMQSAARVWWMFRVFGHNNIAVLNGGLPKWEAEERQLTSESRTLTTAEFNATFRPNLVRYIENIRRFIDGGAEQIIDVRTAGRFTAAEPEPRNGMRSGHMPGAINLPFTELLEGDFKTYKSANAIHSRVEAANIDLSRPITASCGSGVTACALALGLYLIGKEDVAVYDGSWTEWGGRQDTPVVTD